MTSPLNPEILSVLQDLQLRPDPPRLAQEIVDEMIDAVSAEGDKPTLKSLATVARAWRLRSQRNLFQTYNLRISRVILTKAQAERQTSSLDDLFSHVRVLQLHQPRKVAVLMDSIWLLRLFTNVAKLELPYWNFRKVTVSRLAQLLGHFGSTVEELCRLSDQSVEALHPLHVRVFIAGPYLGKYDTSVVLDHLNIIWPGFSEKGEVTLTRYVSITLPTCGRGSLIGDQWDAVATAWTQ
jgi:hypothetical protein